MRYKVVYQYRWLVIIAFIFLIYLSNFILIQIPFISINFPKKDLEHSLVDFLLSFCPRFGFEMQTYNLQMIIAWSCGVLLGPRVGALTLAAYLLIGFLGFPAFAGGGGIDYYKEPTFGYLISLPLNAFLSGWFFQMDKKLLAAFIPIIATHLFGILYLLIFKINLLDISWYLSFSMIGYDLLFALLLVPVLPFFSFFLTEVFIQEKPELAQVIDSEQAQGKSSTRWRK